MDITLLLSRMSTNSSPPDVNPVADTFPIDWEVIDFEYSIEHAKTDKDGGAIHIPAERELWAAHSGELCREAEKKRVVGQRREEELRHRLANVQRKSSSQKKWKTKNKK